MSKELLNNSGDDDDKMPALEAHTRTTSSTDDIQMLSAESVYEMDDNGNAHLPASSDINSNFVYESFIEWSQHETPYDFPPMPPLAPAQSNRTTPPIARTSSNVSLIDASISPTFHDFTPTDLLLDYSTNRMDVSEPGDLLPASVCLPSLLAQSSAMQGDIFSTPTSTGLQNVDDEYSKSFSLSEAEQADTAAPIIDAAAPLLPSSEMSGWHQKCLLLRKYIEDHDGSSDIPQKYPVLGIWVNKQRTMKKKLDEGESSQLTRERAQLLESIGFKWSEPKGQASWEKHFNELVEYKNKTGHCNFPTKPKETELKPLGRWVTTQRSEKKQGLISEEHEAKLNSIGFKWDLKETMFM